VAQAVQAGRAPTRLKRALLTTRRETGHDLGKRLPLMAPGGASRGEHGSSEVTTCSCALG